MLVCLPAHGYHKSTIVQQQAHRPSPSLRGLDDAGQVVDGLVFAFKLHLMVNDQGELLGFRVTMAEVDDREPVEQMVRDLWKPSLGLRVDESGLPVVV